MAKSVAVFIFLMAVTDELRSCCQWEVLKIKIISKKDEEGRRGYCFV